MLSIFLNLIFVSGFCFVFIIVLEYTIYLWENQKVNELTKNILPTENSFESSAKRSFTAQSNYNINQSNMKNPFNNKYFERSLVLVKSQDYKGWFQKTLEMTKKIFTNLGFYSKKAAKYVISLSKTGNQFPDNDEKYFKTEKSTDKINQTVNKINEITEKSADIANTLPTIANITSTPESNSNLTNIVDPKNQFQDINLQTEPVQQNQGLATLNMAFDPDAVNNTPKDNTVYDKIEKSILAKLQEVGLNHYDIWLELGHFYQKYNEKEKATEIFAMVMKHAEGKDKELARDGLIALS